MTTKATHSRGADYSLDQLAAGDQMMHYTRQTIASITRRDGWVGRSINAVGAWGTEYTIVFESGDTVRMPNMILRAWKRKA